VFHGQNADIHDGPAVRIVPMTPELRPILWTLFDHARAGHELWPRLFHNMRASCATDWAEALPALVVAKWLGHSPLLAVKHYLQTRAAHFEVAISGVPRAGKAEAQPVALRGAGGRIATSQLLQPSPNPTETRALQHLFHPAVGKIGDSLR
jgi:hypothetical protein